MLQSTGSQRVGHDLVTEQQLDKGDGVDDGGREAEEGGIAGVGVARRNEGGPELT